MYNKPSFAVLMSTYYRDNPLFLQQAFDSLIMQSLPASELVLVEDGRLTPELDALIAAYRKKLNIISVRLPDNFGLGIALQIGVKLCRTNLIARMDSDDIAVPQRLQLQYEHMLRNPHLAVLGGHIDEFSDNPTTPLRQRRMPLCHSQIKRFAWLRSPFNHMSVMFRKDAILAAGNYRHLPSFEDYDLWLRVLKSGYQCENLDQVLVLARIGNGLMQRRSGWNYVRSELKAVSGFHQYHLIPLPVLGFNLLTRFILRIAPRSVRKLAYHLLRSAN